MYHLTRMLANQARPQLATKVAKAGADQQKFQQLFAQIAHGFNPMHPPENVLLYREAIKLYESGHHASAEVVLRDALAQAKKERCTEATISLYETQLKKVQEFVQSTEKAAKTKWWGTVLSAAGGSGTMCLVTGYYLGRGRVSLLVP